ncbi:TetR/AcrR family transcriptional regulator [soil metagenome]
MATPTATLSRKEKQARTREALLEAALSKIAADGLEGATIDAIAAEAGYTKGAFYANFSSKQELFLVMLDQHFAAESQRLDELLQPDTEPVEVARETSLDFIRRIRAEPRWQSLYFQFAVYAARDEVFRKELLERYAGLIERLERIFRRFAASYDFKPSLPFRELAEMTFFMADGFLLHQLLDGSVSDATYGRMVATFLTGTLAEGSAQSS